MKKLNQMLSEVKGEHAHKEAIAMGLKYKGFGFWADPETGETKYKTENDILTPVVPEQESELWSGGPPGEDGSMDIAKQGIPGQQGMMDPNGMLQMPGQEAQQELGSNVLGAPEPGKEKAPSSQDWKPGPDGDTCVGPDAQIPGVIPKDAYVGKTNYVKWAAGPDGDNMNTVSVEDMYSSDVGKITEETDSWGDTISRWTPKSKRSLASRVRNIQAKAGGGFAGLGAVEKAAKDDIRAKAKAQDEDPMQQKYQTPGVAADQTNWPVQDIKNVENALDRDTRALSWRSHRQEMDKFRDKAAARGLPDPNKTHYTTIDNLLGRISARMDMDFPDTPERTTRTGIAQGRYSDPRYEYPGTKDEPLVGTGKDTLMKRVRGQQEIPMDGQHDREFEAQQELEDMSPEDREKALADIERHGETKRFPRGFEKMQRDVVRKEIERLPAKAKDKEVVQQMNEALRNSGLLQDPDFNMDIDEDSSPLGRGSFGTVHDHAENDDYVIKEGQIGPEELATLHALADIPGVPNLINAEFTTPFRDESTDFNNPRGGETRSHADSKYFDRDDQSYLDLMYPSADGKFAMSRAAGEEFADLRDDLSEEELTTFQEGLWNLRKQIHERGISHNDMHGGNTYFDPDTGEVSLIDFGLAQDDPLSAVMEAFGGHSAEDGQMWEDYRIYNLPTKISGLIDGNRNKIRDSLQERFADRIDADDNPMSHGSIRRLLYGGIRNQGSTLRDIADEFGWLDDDENYSDEGREDMLGLIKQLYEGVDTPWGEIEDVEEPPEWRSSLDREDEGSDPTGAMAQQRQDAVGSKAGGSAWLPMGNTFDADERDGTDTAVQKIRANDRIRNIPGRQFEKPGTSHMARAKRMAKAAWLRANNHDD